MAVARPRLRAALTQSIKRMRRNSARASHTVCGGLTTPMARTRVVRLAAKIATSRMPRSQDGQGLEDLGHPHLHSVNSLAKDACQRAIRRPITTVNSAPLAPMARVAHPS